MTTTRICVLLEEDVCSTTKTLQKILHRRKKQKIYIFFGTPFSSWPLFLVHSSVVVLPLRDSTYGGYGGATTPVHV